MAFAHGSNDAQKTMGIITLALVAAGVLPNANTIPWEVIVISATAISLGTAVGGWRIMHTMGHRVVDLEPIHGFAAETTGATVIYGAALLGMPVSTTHVISSAIMGVGSSKGTARRPLGRGAEHPRSPGSSRSPPRCSSAPLAWYLLNAIGIHDSRLQPPDDRSRPSRAKGTTMVRLIPRDEKFQELFVEDARILLAAARKLEEMIAVYDRLDERVSEIRALEHEGDEIDKEVEARLDRAFITPFDREDIHELGVADRRRRSMASRRSPRPS